MFGRKSVLNLPGLQIPIQELPASQNAFWCLSDPVYGWCCMVTWISLGKIWVWALLTSEDSSEWKVTDSWPDTFTQGLFRMLGGGRAGPGAAGWVTWPVEGALGGHRGLDTEAVQLKQSQLRLSA